MIKKYITRFSAASSSPVASFALRFVRTVILSRLLTPEHVGASVALVTILSSGELITSVGLDLFVIVNSGERRAQAVAAAQQVALLRGLLLAGAIALFTPALADIFSVNATSIYWLSLVPPIASLKNLRVIQLQQEYKYIPDAACTIGGQVGALIAIVIFATWLHDERAMLVSLVAEAAVNVALSYLLTSRERVASVDPTIRRAALLFGLPLVLNGIGLMVLGQADRMIVAKLFDLPTLALYSLTVNLAIAPTSILNGIVSKIAMPFLTRSQADHDKFTRASLILLSGVLLIGAAYAAPVGLLLDRLVPLVYGSRYQVTPAFSALMGGVAFLRFCRYGPSIVLIALSKTTWLTAGNLVSGLGVLIGLLLGMRYGHLESIAVGLLIGDGLSLAFLSLIVGRFVRHENGFRFHAPVVILAVALVALARLTEYLGLAPGLQTIMLVAAAIVFSLDAAIVYNMIVAERGRSSPAIRSLDL